MHHFSIMKSQFIKSYLQPMNRMQSSFF